MPPIPGKVVTDTGKVIFTKHEIEDGQNIWQRMGGQELGSVWGHGAYVAPDWTADLLHRELTWMLDQWSSTEFNKTYDQLTLEQQAQLKARLKKEIRTNTYDASTDTLVVSSLRAGSIQFLSDYYNKVFGDDPSMNAYREQIAVPANTIGNAADRNKMSAFFFWATWATSTDRPGQDITYTNNWPGEPLIDNTPTSSSILWSIVSVILLIAGWHVVCTFCRLTAQPLDAKSNLV